MRNSNLESLKQLIKGLSGDERDELLMELINSGQEQSSNKLVGLPVLSPQKTVIERSVESISNLDYREFGLSESHYLFCIELIENGFNATKAYITTMSPDMSPVVAKAAAARLRHDPLVSRFLEALFDRVLISNREVELRLQGMLNISLEDFIGADGNSIDLVQAKELGALAGVQRLRKTEHGWDVQLFDRVKLLDILTRTRGMQKQVRVTADLDKLAREFGMDVTELMVAKDQLKEQYKNQLLSGES